MTKLERTQVEQLSLQKKRLRDRRAQNARRERQDNRLRQLEDQVAHCKANHGNLHINEDVHNLRLALEALRAENASLRRRHAAAIDVLQGDEKLIKLTAIQDSQSSPTVYSQSEDSSITPGPAEDSPARPNHAPHGFKVQTLMPWLICPAIALPLPDTPLAVDLLYGSRDNPLANAIYIATSCARFGKVAEPERLGMGWLLYVYAKWVLDPHMKQPKHLPDFMLPTMLQQTQPHTALIDHIVWPEIRDNFIRAYGDTEPDDLLEALRCMAPEVPTWPARVPLLELHPRRAGQLVIRSAFLETFVKLENWAISPEFVRRYPALVKGTAWEPA